MALQLNAIKLTDTEPITVKEAIAESCNDYMMHIGKLLGAKKFVQYQERFGFGTKTGIDLPNETRGLVYGTDMGRQHLQLTHLVRTLQ